MDVDSALLLSQMSDMVLTFDFAGHLIESNSAAQQRLAPIWSDLQIEGWPVLVRYLEHQPDNINGLHNAWQQVRNQGGMQQVVPGIWRDWQVHLTARSHPHADILVIINDHVRRQIPPLVDRVSHDLRSLLGFTVGFARLLQMDTNEPELQQRAADIIDFGLHTADAVDGFTELVHTRFNPFTAPLIPVKFDRIIEWLMSTETYLLNQYTHRIDIDVPPDLVVQGDVVLLESILGRTLRFMGMRSQEIITLRAEIPTGQTHLVLHIIASADAPLFHPDELLLQPFRDHGNKSLRWRSEMDIYLAWVMAEELNGRLWLSQIDGHAAVSLEIPASH